MEDFLALSEMVLYEGIQTRFGRGSQKEQNPQGPIERGRLAYELAERPCKPKIRSTLIHNHAHPFTLTHGASRLRLGAGR